MAVLTLQQVKDAYQAQSGIFRGTFVLRDYILYLIYVYAYNASTGGGSTEGTLTSTNPNTSGTITAGAKSINIMTSDDFTGTINGVSRIGSWNYVFPSVQGYTYPAIAYVITTGSLTIDKLY